VEKLFFFDDFCFDTQYGFERRFMEPQCVPQCHFVDDRPEIAGTEYATVHWDQRRQVYRMWYIAWLQNRRRALCAAESEDGLEWKQIDRASKLGEGLPSNAVFAGETSCEQGVVFVDEFDSDESRRYKLAYWDLPAQVQREDVDSGRKCVMRLAFSADGESWSIAGGGSWHPENSETQNKILCNPVTGRYQIICRKTNVDRRVALTESEDLKEWTDPRVIIHPDPADEPGLQFYGMPAYWYEDIFVGFLWRYRTGTQINGQDAYQGDGIIEPELTYSYDGLTWNRTRVRVPRRVDRGQFGGSRLYPESLVIDPDGNVRLYSRGVQREHQHHSPFGTAYLLHKWRADGFVGMESCGNEGFLRTKPFLLKDKHIALNVQAPYGRVRVQITDQLARPLPGFSFAECRQWTGDDVHFCPQWEHKHDLSELVGRIVRFEVKVEEAVLYSIRATVEPHHGLFPLARY